MNAELLLLELQKMTEGKLLKLVSYNQLVKLKRKHDKDELSKAFKELIKQKKIRIREGINNKLVELI